MLHIFGHITEGDKKRHTSQWALFSFVEWLNFPDLQQILTVWIHWNFIPVSLIIPKLMFNFFPHPSLNINVFTIRCKLLYKSFSTTTACIFLAATLSGFLQRSAVLEWHIHVVSWSSASFFSLPLSVSLPLSRTTRHFKKKRSLTPWRYRMSAASQLLTRTGKKEFGVLWLRSKWETNYARVTRNETCETASPWELHRNSLKRARGRGE